MLQNTPEYTAEIRFWLKEKVCSRTDFPSNQQHVHTPFELCHEIIDRLERSAVSLHDKTFLVFNLEFVEVLCYDFGVKKENIWFVTDCKQKANVIKHPRYAGVKVEPYEYLSLENNAMKFDVICGNPPYQTKSDASNTKTQPLWDKFVAKSFGLLKENGYLCMVHPSGWRSGGNIFKDAKVLKDKQIQYLEIHSEQDGNKTFGATTRYDWYVIKNCSASTDTVIKDQDGVVVTASLVGKNFIPNSQIEKVYSMFAQADEKRCEIIGDSSYHTQRTEIMSKDKGGKFKHPVIYSTPVDGPTIWYSSTNDRGHFGVSKIIFNPCRPIGFVVDSEGKYGMSQFCVGIVGDEKYLKMVANVLQNQKTNGFAEFMEVCHFTDKVFNKEVVGNFRKDFWKAFV